MLIACTKSAARALNQKVLPFEGDVDPFFCWHVKLFSTAEGKLFLFMNELSRLPLFILMESVGKTSVQERFLNLIRAVIQHMGFPDSISQAYLQDVELQYVKVFNLSIVSQMNSLSRVYQYEAVYGTQYCTNELAAVIKYAQIPCFKYDIYPYKVFQAELMKRYG